MTVIEDLNEKYISKTAAGTLSQPGRNIRQIGLKPFDTGPGLIGNAPPT